MRQVATASPAHLDSCVLCHECDLLVDLSGLEEGQRADCPRCGYLLSSRHRDANTRIVVFAISGLCCLAMSTGFDFIELTTVGLQRELSLPQTVSTLFSLREWSLAAFMGVIVLGLPTIFLSALGVLAGALALGRAGRWCFRVLRFISVLRFWNMAEIFFLGILVSMVKIAGMAHVQLGAAFWSYAFFNLFLILALLNVDLYQLGREIRRQTESPSEVPS